ncbi:MAG TPA: tRNA (adenosine(37)-N6)-threonylcarbamoyltransferase complex dimerization subunit type 1 TsaB [Phycisphaerae bacterium]|nr:tRNA (adenosine(37)-N6)-threonylcarbamoyltransferase complex dimerization subunit type 1 TsaB [Phycisphaerales bacterium]HRX84360.1 tRNA (adenosine(37)-N6)-threonylcarbamoyltransferase complex dimerization subunit type 1 TsaB [Phycisphaerae bacterium]
MTPSNDADVAIAVETSGSQGSVAVGRGAAVLAEETFDARQAHSVALLPTADRLLAACAATPRDLRRVYVSVGPGSFTGLRIGVTFARTIAFAAGARIVPVSSLATVAQNAATMTDPPERVAVLLDAKRRHVFAQCFAFDGTAYAPVDEAAERDPADYLPSLGAVAVLGEGVARHGAALAACPAVTVLSGEFHQASARAVYALGTALAAEGRFVEADALTPVYIRRPEAEERWEQRQGAGKP